MCRFDSDRVAQTGAGLSTTRLEQHVESGGIIDMRHARKGADWGRAERATAHRASPDIGLYHVAGILVYAAPAREHEVRSGIQTLPGAVVHAHAGGQIVATLEGPVSSELVAALDTIQRLPGVLSAVLISEHSEPIEGIDEEIPHDR
ncbi:MAG: chaperone NapD [Burkholderiales bacterium]